MKAIIATLAVATALCAPGLSTNAATITVTNLADNGVGSLRDAFQTAADGDTIDASSVTGTITLTSGELLVTNSLTILGSGPASLAVDGNGSNRVFNVSNAGNVTISSLTITNGFTSGGFPTNSGGGVFNYTSSVMVSNCVVTGNFAPLGGAVFNGGIGASATLAILNSTVNDNTGTFGGAICNLSRFSGSASLMVLSSTINNNSADGGGGVYNFGDGFSLPATATIVNSTLSHNSANTGGGIYNVGFSAAGATLSIANSTFSGNSATNGGDTIRNSASSAGATVEIGNTILKAGGSGSNIVNDSGAVASLGYNLSSDDGGGFLTATGDQLSTDPMLGPLADNGGPTLTHALLDGSPAINAGDPSFTPPPDFDQRGPGFSRVVAGRIDIGAFESGSNLNFRVTNTNDSGEGSLRVALETATDGDTIDASSVTGTIILTTGELLITNAVTIRGPSATNLVVDGNGDRVFHIQNAGSVSLSSLTISNGNSGVQLGAGIFNEHSTLVVSNCVVTGNTSESNGAGVYNDGSSGNGDSVLTIIRSIVHGNAGFRGAGIFNDGRHVGSAKITLIDTTISDNIATNQGGGIFSSASDVGIAEVNILSSTLSSNLTAGSDGGGIFNEASQGIATLTITNSTLSGNMAAFNGGAIYNDCSGGGTGTVQIAHTTFSGNSSGSGSSGGGIYNNGNNNGDAMLEIGDTILDAGNFGGTLTNDNGTVVSHGYNLSSDGNGPNDGSTDLLNSDPMLGPLADNGGPTQTHPLLSGSTAIDAGDPNFTPPPAFDQRGPGFPRMIGPRIDIGALEAPTCVGFGGFNAATGSPLSVRGPVSIAMGDFNGNGNLDLAIANFNTNTVTILLGNGDGTFSTNSLIPVGSNPLSIVSADFNGNGNIDLAVANLGTNSVSVLLGNGDGTFAEATNSPISVASPASLAVGDFNGDDKLDFAVANFASNTVTIVLGNGDGTFEVSTNYPVGTKPLSVAVGDFNTNGIADLVIANSTTNTVTILLGNGDGTFTEASGSPVSVGGGPLSVAVGDLNGNGNVDLAVVNTNGNTVTILLGNGDGTFSEATNSPIQVGSGPASVQIGDFNGDGKPDLAIANFLANTVTILLGNGDGTFSPAPHSRFTVGFAPYFLGIGDFNGDERPDLAVANYGGNTLSILLTSCTNICPTISLLPSSLPTGTVGVAYNRLITSANAEGAATFTVTNGLPSGLSLSESGTMSGTPTEEGDFTFTIIATDTNNCVGSREYTLTINPAPLQAHQDVLNALQDIRTHVSNKSDAGKLDATLKLLNKSVAAENWMDGTHPTKRGGTKVFASDAAAAKALKRLIASNQSGLSTNQLQGLIDSLVVNDRTLAQIAISEATADTTKAQANLASGDASANAGKPDRAINSYKKAWKLAAGK